MMTRAEFDGFYGSKLRDGIASANAEAARMKRGFVVAMCVFVALCLAGVAVFEYYKTLGSALAAAACCLPALGVAIRCHDAMTRAIRTMFYGTVVPELIASVPEAKLRFAHEDRLSRKAYHACKLFPSSVDRYTGSNRICGTYRGVALDLSFLHTEDKRRDSRGHTSYSTIFRGVLAQFDFHKEFRGRTLVLPDVAESLFGKTLGKFFQKMRISSTKLIKMESSEFEKHFVVYGENDMTARYILTPAMMERMVALRVRLGKSVRFSFVDSALFVAVDTSREFLGLRDKRRITHEFVFEAYSAIVSFVSIVDDLSLDVRIWSKA